MSKDNEADHVEVVIAEQEHEDTEAACYLEVDTSVRRPKRPIRCSLRYLDPECDDECGPEAEFWLTRTAAEKLAKILRRFALEEKEREAKRRPGRRGDPERRS